MKVYDYINLKDFEFCGVAEANMKMLTTEELNRLDDYFDNGEPMMSACELNNLFWFEFETVCEILGLEYDAENDEIKRRGV